VLDLRVANPRVASDGLSTAELVVGTTTWYLHRYTALIGDKTQSLPLGTSVEVEAIQET